MLSVKSTKTGFVGKTVMQSGNGRVQTFTRVPGKTGKNMAGEVTFGVMAGRRVTLTRGLKNK